MNFVESNDPKPLIKAFTLNKRMKSSYFLVSGTIFYSSLIKFHCYSRVTLVGLIAEPLLGASWFFLVNRKLLIKRLVTSRILE